jgi:5'-3' exonuclease
MLEYQVAFASQWVDDDGELQIAHFDQVAERMDNLITEICEAVGATSHVLYLTGKGNFREAIAKRQVYKGTRKPDKPFHYANMRAYLKFSHNAVVVDGMEADDAMVIEQMKDYWSLFGSKDNSEQHSRVCKTVICSRDKDLRICPGWHYSWECYNQPEKPMYWVDELGEFNPKYKQKVSKKTGNETTVFHKLEATGLRMFYAQLLMGDTVDNIPGLPGCGAKGAYDALQGCLSEIEMYEVCLSMYSDKYLDEAVESFSVYAAETGLDRDSTDLEYEDHRDVYTLGFIEDELIEQARLLWMVNELHEDGSPVMWEVPDA